MGCHSLQGFLLGKPMSVESVESLMTQDRLTIDAGKAG